jgi:hypothetical protein
MTANQRQLLQTTKLSWLNRLDAVGGAPSGQNWLPCSFHQMKSGVAFQHEG